MKGKRLDPVQYQETFVGTCLVCTKPVVAFYGRWGVYGTCSGKCEKVQKVKPTTERNNQPNPAKG